MRSAGHFPGFTFFSSHTAATHTKHSNDSRR